MKLRVAVATANVTAWAGEGDTQGCRTFYILLRRARGAEGVRQCLSMFSPHFRKHICGIYDRGREGPAIAVSIFKFSILDRSLGETTTTQGRIPSECSAVSGTLIL